MSNCPTPAKHRHATEGGAWKQYQSLKKTKLLGRDWNVYLCACGFWHVGHKPGSLAKRAKQALRGGRR